MDSIRPTLGEPQFGHFIENSRLSTNNYINYTMKQAAKLQDRENTDQNFLKEVTELNRKEQ